MNTIEKPLKSVNNNLKHSALSFGDWKVFPIAEGCKTPPLVKWGRASTSDKATIRDWWSKTPRANIGLACGQSGIAVIDVDVKDGRRGLVTLEMLELVDGLKLSETRMQRTPSGGLQYFYRGDIPTSQNTIGKRLWADGVSHIDSRGIGGSGGYVLLPPSETIDNAKDTKSGKYEWINGATFPIAPLDPWVIDLFDAQSVIGHDAVSQEFVVEPDLPGNIEWFRRHLENDAPIAIEGRGGEARTLALAGVAKDHGLSEDIAFDTIYFSSWNERCEPPWEYEELKTKVNNAYSYLKQVAPGSETAEAHFSGAPLTAHDEKFLEEHAPAKPEQSSKSKAKGSTALGLIWANSVKAKSIKWIWPGHLALGQHTCLAGVQGDGKSQLVYSLIATITTAGTWPGSKEKAPLGYCVILSAEDTDADVLVPRLLAAGADLSRVAIIKGTPNKAGDLCKFNLQADILKLQEVVEDINKTKGQVQLISIDPITSYLGDQIDGNGNVELRHAIDPVGKMAEATGAAVLSVTHFAKASKGISALNRIIGSIAFTAAPRAAFVVVRDGLDEASRLLLPVKANLMSFSDAYGMAFRIEEADTGERDPDTKEMIRAPRVRWGERDTRSADAVLNPVKVKEDGGAMSEAKNFLRDELADGPQLVKDVRRWSADAGIAYITLRRAYEVLGVKASKRAQADGHGPWEWSLPPDVDGYCPAFADDAANADLFA